VTEIQRGLQGGDMKALERPGEHDGIVLGKDLAAKLGVKVDDTVSVLTTAEVLTPMGPRPRTRTLRVGGIFSLGLYEFDSTYGFLSLDVAERLLGKPNTALTIQLRVDDVYRAPAIADSIPEQLGGDYVAQDWADVNKSLFSALWLEKIAV